MSVSCPSGKIGYANRALARRVAREVKSRKGGEPLEEFRCTYCGQWHNGRNNDVGRSLQRWRKIQQFWGQGGRAP